MITKNDLQEMFKSNEGRVFTIKTNIANGHGLNGTSYDYVKSVEHIEHGRVTVYEEKGTYTRCEKSEDYKYVIAEITDSMIVFDKVVIYKEFWSQSTEVRKHTTKRTKMYLPIDKIQSIEFEMD